LYKGLAANGNASAAYELAMLAYSGAMGEENRKQSKPWLEQAFVNGNQQAGQMLQWLNAQNDTRVSFIEPVVWTQQVSSNGESAHWAYLGVLNAWNQGNTGDFRVLLNRLVQEYPNYSPAKEAYAHMQENQAWEQS
jgi:enhanced entry protein EnhC